MVRRVVRAGVCSIRPCLEDSSRGIDGAGGGSRTIHAYSFYVTYCKHTNARTAKPSVCPPPMYKIMYKKFEGRVSRRPLNAGLRSSPSRIQHSIRELTDGNVSRQVDATRVGRAACVVRIQDHTFIADHSGPNFAFAERVAHAPLN